MIQTKAGRYDLSMKYLQQIEANAFSKPDSIAIQCSTGATMAYGSLWKASEAIAAYIGCSGIPKQEPIVVYGHKSPYMVACFLGCLKSGHPYVPIDMYSVPNERALSIVDQIGKPLIFDLGGGVSLCRLPGLCRRKHTA